MIADAAAPPGASDPLGSQQTPRHQEVKQK